MGYLTYTINESGRFRGAARISCTALGQVIYQDFKALGRMPRPHQGDTVSPRRGLNISATDRYSEGYPG